MKNNVVINRCQWVIALAIFMPNRAEALLLIITLFFLFLRYGIVFRSRILKFLILVFLISTISTYLIGYNYDKSIQQMIVLSVFILGYEQFFLFVRGDFRLLFSKYIRICLIISIFGLIQELYYLIAQINIMSFVSSNYGTQLINNNLIRISATTWEGGYLGTILTPCLFYLFYYNDPYKLLGWKKYVILFVALLTLSPFVFILLSIVFMVKLIHISKLNRTVLIAMLLCIFLYAGFSLQTAEYERDTGGVNGVFMRIKDSFQMMQLITADDISRISELNTSTATLASNMYIGFNAPSRLMGTGIGTNSQNHQKIMGKTFDDSFDFVSLNTDDGYSLFNRILSELGVIGLLFYLFFVYKFFNKNNDINKCLFIIIACWFIRGGNYVIYGTIFFHFFYYYTSKFQLRFK